MLATILRLEGCGSDPFRLQGLELKGLFDPPTLGGVLDVCRGRRAQRRGLGSRV